MDNRESPEPRGPRGPLARSFVYAFSGLAYLLRTQRNARVHTAATVMVVLVGWLLGVSGQEWCLLALAIGGVWVAETFNTVLEILVDAFCPDQHPLAGRAKDLAATAVLLAALISVVIGLLVFVPHLLDETASK